jgi:hypothetical protein
VKKTLRDVSEIPPMDDEELERFWETHSPEDFQGWAEGGLKFTRPAKRRAPNLPAWPTLIT